MACKPIDGLLRGGELRRWGENIEESRGRGHTGVGESSRPGDRSLSRRLPILGRGSGLARCTAEASLGQITSKLIHLNLFFLVLHVEQFHIFFKASFLFSHILNMLSLLLELLRIPRSVSTVGFNQQIRGNADSEEEYMFE